MKRKGTIVHRDEDRVLEPCQVEAAAAEAAADELQLGSNNQLLIKECKRSAFDQDVAWLARALEITRT